MGGYCTRGQLHRRKCRHCRQWFTPDARTANRHRDPDRLDSPLVVHQRYCPDRACQAASKRHSRYRWRRQNADYDTGQTARVRRWRAAHPGYSRRQTAAHHVQVAIMARSDISGGQYFSIRSVVRTTGALQEMTYSEGPVHARLALIWDCPLREPMVLLSAESYVA